jgi:hypothetical protein
MGIGLGQWRSMFLCRLILSSSLIRFISVSAKLTGDFSINRQKRSDLLAALPLLELFSFAALQGR